jgi:ribosomal protein L37E
MALAVEGPLLEGLLRRLSSTLNEIISLRFRFGTRRPTDITIIIIIINYKKYILKQTHIDELCRRCGKESETIQQITAVCGQLARTEYVKRHDGLAKIIHQKLEAELK